MENVTQEIVRLHEFFEDWMTGKLTRTDENFAQFADSLSTNFYIVTPSAQLTQKDVLLSRLYDTHNQRQNFRIWIKNVEVRHILEDVVVATYEEWQETEGDEKPNALLSTVVFTQDHTKPNNLLWQCVHETRLQQ
jgi:hypothetical protein